MTARLPRSVGLGAVLFAFALPLVGAFTDVGGAMEEGFMLVFPERVLAGDVPNRDFLHLYGPGGLWVLAAAFAAFGVSIHVERVVGAVQLLGVVLALRAWVAPWGQGAATIAGLVAVVFAITPIGLVALAWMGALALLLWGLLLVVRALEEGRAWRATVGGVLCGVALLYRPDLVAALVLAGVVLVPALGRSRLLVRAASGVAAGAAPMVVHAAMAGVTEAFEGMVVDPVFRLRAGRHLPVPPSSDRLDSFLQRVNELDVIQWPQPFSIPMQLRIWFFVVVVATGLVVVGAIRAWRRDRGDGRGRRLAVLAAVCAGILSQAMQRPDSAHLAWVSVVTLALLPVAIAEVTPSVMPRRRGIVVGAVVTLVLVVAAFPAFTIRPYAELTLQSFGRERNAVEVRNGERLFYVGTTELASAANEVVDVVREHAREGDRLFVGPSDLTRTPFVDTWLYHLFPDLEPATYYLEMDPGLANASGSRLADDLASADFAILTTTWSAWSEPNDSAQRGDTRAAGILRDRFCEIATSGPMTVYRPCHEIGP